MSVCVYVSERPPVFTTTSSKILICNGINVLKRVPASQQTAATAALLAARINIWLKPVVCSLTDYNTTNLHESCRSVLRLYVYKFAQIATLRMKGAFAL